MFEEMERMQTLEQLFNCVDKTEKYFRTTLENLCFHSDLGMCALIILNSTEPNTNQYKILFEIKSWEIARLSHWEIKKVNINFPFLFIQFDLTKWLIHLTSMFHCFTNLFRYHRTHSLVQLDLLIQCTWAKDSIHSKWWMW